MPLCIVLFGILHYQSLAMPLRFIQLSILFFVFLYWQEVVAQDQSKWYKKFHPDTLVNRDVTFFPMPIVQSSPETGVRVGFSLDYFFNTGQSQDSIQSRDSFAWLVATYSTRRQLVIEPIWQIYTRNEKYLLRGQAGHTDFSEYFWGIGREVLNLDSPTNMFYSRTYLQGEFLRKIVPNVFAGLQLQVSATRNITFDSSTGDLLNDVRGRNSSHTAGIGPNLIFDFRNNPFSPTQGWFLELSYVPHNRKLQSEYTFKEVLVDGRKYFELPKNQFIGFQTLGNFSWGDVPLRELPRLGGSNMMRGIVQGRYRDKNMMALQAEYRKGLNRFLKIAAFSGAGMVSENVRNFSKQNIYFTYGLGLRILVNKKKNLYSRVDIARSSEGNFAFYFKLMDAF